MLSPVYKILLLLTVITVVTSFILLLVYYRKNDCSGKLVLCNSCCDKPVACDSCCDKPTTALWDKLSGQNLLDKFSLYPTAQDPTGGAVDYSYCKDNNCELISTENNRLKIMVAGAGNNIPIPPGNVPSVRLYTEKTTFNGGIFSFEIFHIPAGCGVWPAIWFGQDSNQKLPNGEPGKWPQNGEIDLIEQVNDTNRNSTTLHIAPQNPQCTPTFKVPLSGGDPTCSTADNNIGCGSATKIPNTFGKDFNTNYGTNGATTVLKWELNKSITAWFIPPPYDDVTGPFGTSPDPSKWPDPYFNAEFNNTTCPILNQQLIFNITLCGVWAGDSPVWGQNCPNKGSCNDYIHTPNALKDAYWDIGRVSIYPPEK